MRKVLAALVVSLLLGMGAESLAGGRGALGDCRMRLLERRTDIRVGFAMHTPSPERDWRVVVLDERRRVFRRIVTTDSRGDFLVRTVIRRRPGFRRYEGRASEVGTGVVCSVVLRT